METYEINPKTMAIIPISKKTSKVYEDETDFLVQKSPIEIIDHSCRFFGSSYQGRHIGTKSLLGISYKTPILVEETRNIIFFPTTSSRSEECCWISLDKIQNYKKNDINSIIIFKNGHEISLDISIGSLQNQILRSAMLDSIIRKRKKIS